MVWLGSFLVWTVTTVYACWIILRHVRRRSTRAKELRRELLEWQTAVQTTIYLDALYYCHESFKFLNMNKNSLQGLDPKDLFI